MLNFTRIKWTYEHFGLWCAIRSAAIDIVAVEVVIYRLFNVIDNALGRARILMNRNGNIYVCCCWSLI